MIKLYNNTFIEKLKILLLKNKLYERIKAGKITKQLSNNTAAAARLILLLNEIIIVKFNSLILVIYYVIVVIESDMKYIQSNI